MSKKVRFPGEPSDHGPGPHYPQTPKQEIVFHALIMTAAVVIVLGGVKMASGILAPVLLALFATIILLVPLRWLRSKGCPSILSLVIVLGCVAIVFLGLTRLVVNSLTELSKDAPRYARKIEREFHRVETGLEQMGFKINYGTEGKKEQAEESSAVTPPNSLPQAEPLSAAQPNVPPVPILPPTIAVTPIAEKAEADDAMTSATDSPGDQANQVAENSSEDAADESVEGNGKQVDKTLFDHARDTFPNLFPHHDDAELMAEEELAKDQPVQHHVEPSLTELNAQSLLAWFSKTANELRHLVEKGFLVMIITLFMIFEAARFPAKIDRAFGKGPITNEHLHKIAIEIRRYLFLKAISSAMSAGAATLVYLFFGVPGALFWGVIAFFLYFIPNIGGILAAIIPGLLIFMELGPVGVLGYVVCLVAIECTIGYGIEPKILGYGLGISTVMIILSLIIWGWLLGAIGLFLAAPLTIMVKIILQAFKETEWIAILIGDGSDRTP